MYAASRAKSRKSDRSAKKVCKADEMTCPTVPLKKASLQTNKECEDKERRGKKRVRGQPRAEGGYEETLRPYKRRGGNRSWLFLHFQF